MKLIKRVIRCSIRIQLVIACFGVSRFTQVRRRNLTITWWYNWLERVSFCFSNSFQKIKGKLLFVFSLSSLCHLKQYWKAALDLIQSAIDERLGLIWKCLFQWKWSLCKLTETTVTFTLLFHFYLISISQLWVNQRQLLSETRHKMTTTLNLEYNRMPFLYPRWNLNEIHNKLEIISLRLNHFRSTMFSSFIFRHCNCQWKKT